MINIPERAHDIITIINKLDISPTMYQNAVEKYQALAKFLNENGVGADIYPQGSFAFGTVVRPYSQEKDPNYDLDFICQISATRDDISAKDLFNQVRNVLQNSDRYSDKLVICDECLTIEYADINGVGFNIDIVPATAENDIDIERLRSESLRPDLIDSSIAIPFKRDDDYIWKTNNPKGFVKWFTEINLPFFSAVKTNYKNNLFVNYRQLYNSVEEIPDALVRTPLQQVIQILKYHRSVYYSHIKNGDSIKPISAIINTVVAQMAKSTRPTQTTEELLKFILDELKIYSHRQGMDFIEFRQLYGDRNIIYRENGKWSIVNPANPEDNLADHWNEDSEIPAYFFRWIDAAYNDLIESLSLNDYQFRSQLENAFGSNTVQNVLGNKYTNVQPVPINASHASKPYNK